METEGEKMNSKTKKTKKGGAKAVTEKQFKEYEVYSIVMLDGMKQIHIDRYLWKSYGREEDTKYTVTEYTFCIVPLNDVVELDPSERREYLDECESNVQQYENDYTWNEFKKEGHATPGNAKHLKIEELTEKTPCGTYYCYI